MGKERSLTFSILTFILMSLTGCFTDFNVGCDLKDKKAAFQLPEAYYKKEVLENIPNYTRLRDFIISNMDTIYSYNEKKSIKMNSHISGENDSVRNHIDHFAFYDYGKGNMIKDQVPPDLYPQLMKIYRVLDKNNFLVVSFERDSTVNIAVYSSEYNSKNVRIVHDLHWRNHKVVFQKDSTSLSRDTTLTNGWVYAIYIDCYEGI